MSLTARFLAFLNWPPAQVVAKAFLRGYVAAAAVLAFPQLAQGRFDVGATIRAIADPVFLYVFFNAAFSAGLVSAWAELRPSAFDFLFRSSTSTPVLTDLSNLPKS